TVTADQAKAWGVQVGGKPGAKLEVSGHRMVVIDDQPSDAGIGKSVWLQTAQDKGCLIYPAHTAGTKVISGTVVRVDASKTSRLGDTVYVVFEYPDLAAGKYRPLGTEPVPMSIAEARKLGISLGHDGTLRVDKNDFILNEVTKDSHNKVMMDGK